MLRETGHTSRVYVHGYTTENPDLIKRRLGIRAGRTNCLRVSHNCFLQATPCSAQLAGPDSQVPWTRLSLRTTFASVLNCSDRGWSFVHNRETRPMGFIFRDDPSQDVYKVVYKLFWLYESLISIVAKCATLDCAIWTNSDACPPSCSSSSYSPPPPPLDKYYRIPMVKLRADIRRILGVNKFPNEVSNILDYGNF